MNDQQNEEFRQQLRDNAVSVVNEFLTNAKYDAVRPEYAAHFDDIKRIVHAYRPKYRMCAEDIGYLSHAIKEAISQDSLFFQELHRAISEEILTKEMLCN